MATVETKAKTQAHLIHCINHSDVVPFIVSFFPVLAEHSPFWLVILGTVGVRINIGWTGYEVNPLPVRMAGISAVTIGLSGTVSSIGWITGFVVLSQLLQHVHRAILFLALHMRHQVLGMVLYAGKEAFLLDTAQFSGLEPVLVVFS